MISNGKDYPTGTTLKTHVCIIGSGPAGLTAAWELQKAGIEVIVIEGGRDNRKAGNEGGLKLSWADKKLLYGGEADGFPPRDSDFLILPQKVDDDPKERERYFGGTSYASPTLPYWAQCRPAEPVDFMKRFGDSPGWPIDLDDLHDYYKRASVLCKLHGDYPENFTADYWAKVLGAKVPTLEKFDVAMYQFVGKDYRNFATRTFDDGNTIWDYPLINVILNATLIDIYHARGTVKHLRVASMNDSNPPQKATEFKIKADAYVLACGAVANARQLLLSNAGNEYDLVGRYFMCHPLSGGIVNTTKDYLTPDEAKLMNDATPPGELNGVTTGGRFIPNWPHTMQGIGRCWFWYWNRQGWNNQYYFEMAPNPNSRVTLSNNREEVFNQRKTKIHWELSDFDRGTYVNTTRLFGSAVDHKGGKVTFADWDTVKTTSVVNGHHIGTTRMASSPTKGVVDQNLKVHSLNNLYVAGASVFPSALISNPTFTIIALSIRLADHLQSKLGCG